MTVRSLSVLMPAFDEQDGIERAVLAALVCLDRLQHAGAIGAAAVLVVDDGSTDDTWARLQVLAASDRRVLALRHDQNRGLGAALRTGFAAVATDLVFYTDADLPADLDAVDRSLRIMERSAADLVIGYRRTMSHAPLRRRLYSVGYRVVCRVVLGVRARDVNFAAKLIDRRVLDEVDLVSEGSLIDAELLARAARRGFCIEQFPVDGQPRTSGRSTLSSLPVIWGIVCEMVAHAGAIRRTERLATSHSGVA